MTITDYDFSEIKEKQNSVAKMSASINVGDGCWRRNTLVTIEILVTVLTNFVTKTLTLTFGIKMSSTEMSPTSLWLNEL